MVASYKELSLADIDASLRIRDVLASLEPIKGLKYRTPILVELLENPRFRIGGRNLGIMPGSVDIDLHDCLHILLGRSFLPANEAFVVGFTMGSTQRMSWITSKLFRLIASHAYPRTHRFRPVDGKIFERAVAVGARCATEDLSRLRSSDLVSMTVGSARRRFLDGSASLREAYRWECSINPEETSSFRLRDCHVLP